MANKSFKQIVAKGLLTICSVTLVHLVLCYMLFETTNGLNIMELLLIAALFAFAYTLCLLVGSFIWQVFESRVVFNVCLSIAIFVALILCGIEYITRDAYARPTERNIILGLDEPIYWMKFWFMCIWFTMLSSAIVCGFRDGKKASFFKL